MPHHFKHKIELDKSPVKIVRKEIVPKTINLLQLHLIIQEAMGWENLTPFEFNDIKWSSIYRFGLPAEFDDGEVKAAHEVSFEELNEMSPKKFWYWYNFIDDWWHKVSFQKISKKDQKIIDQAQSDVICLFAIGACPPEHCGGVKGYSRFLEAINDPQHLDYTKLRNTLSINGDTHFDAELVDIEFINKKLSMLQNTKEWSGKVEDLF